MSLIDALLLLGIVVIVPTAVPLHPGAGRSHAAVALVAGIPAGPALLLDPGVPAGLLALPWLVASATAAALSARWWLSGRRDVLDLVWVMALVYLTVGAGWLVADRLGLQPAGVGPPFVQLTAVHFHYAGFASSLLAGCALRYCPSRTPAVAASLIVGAPPIVAVGFTTYGPLQIVGAALLTAGLWLLAWEIVRRIGPEIGGLAGVLLVVSSLATVVPMVLAVQWAIGANYATPALSVPAMARLHGITNAIGFTFLGVLGWRLSTVEPHVPRTT